MWSFVLEGLGLCGAYFVARKVWWAWLILSANSVLWVIYGWMTKQWGFVLSSTAFFVIYLRNAHHWWRSLHSAEPAATGGLTSPNHAPGVARLTSVEP